MTSALEKLVELEKKKSKIADSINEANETLKLHKVGLHEPLVDKDNFPRADVPIAEIRASRQRLICLLNDHKKIIEEIAALLPEYFKEVNHEPGARPKITLSYEPYKKMAEVFDVVQGSAAERAGILRGDILIEFGSINGGNFTSIYDIHGLIKSSNSGGFKVILLRNDSLVRVNLLLNEGSTVGFAIRPVQS